jgi:hypothetical protein
VVIPPSVPLTTKVKNMAKRLGTIKRIPDDVWPQIAQIAQIPGEEKRPSTRRMKATRPLREGL